MTEAAKGTGAAFDAAVVTATSEGRRLTTEERLLNPMLQREIAAQKTQAIESAERAVDKAKGQLKAAEKALAVARKENG